MGRYAAVNFVHKRAILAGFGCIQYGFRGFDDLLFAAFRYFSLRLAAVRIGRFRAILADFFWVVAKAALATVATVPHDEASVGHFGPRVMFGYWVTPLYFYRGLRGFD
jgi:hypothetical protein